MAKAKADTKKLTPEEKAKEKERQKRLKEEEKELKKKAKEKEKRKKDREKQRRKKEKIEERRIRGILNFPFKTLFFASALISLIVFVMMYFGSNQGIDDAIYFSAMLFIFLFLAIGAVMVGGFYVISEERIKVMKLEKQKEEQAEKERIAQEEEELERLLQAELDELEMEKNKSASNRGLLETGEEDKEIQHQEPEPGYSPSDDLESQMFGGSDETDTSNEDDIFNETQSNEQESEIPQLEESSSAQNMPEFSMEKEMEKEAEREQESPDQPFFSEEDFMSDVVFGSKDK